MQEALTNIDVEKTVLGCMLLESTTLHRVLPLLKPSDFCLESHRRIFHVIADLAESGKPVDEMTVVDALISKGQLESVGGAAYVTSLIEKVTLSLAKVTNVEHYAGVIRDKSRRRRARAAGEALVAATLDPSVTTEECLRLVQETLLQIEADSGRSTARHAKDFMPKVVHEIETQAMHQGIVGMTTGLRSLDVATGGIREGELWTIGAMPGRGKTALGVQTALANAAAGTPTCAFSLEMQDVEMGKRFLAAKSSFSALQIRNPHAIGLDRWPELLEAAASVVALPIYVDDRPTLTVQELRASARLYIRQHGVKLIIVDYLRLVTAPGRELRERVANVANGLRELAKTERIGVVLLSQLRRPEGGINAKPTMLDLKESGDIEAHSHVVVLPYLPITDNGGPLPDEQLLIIGKNRNGRMGPLPVFFDERRLQFVDRTAH